MRSKEEAHDYRYFPEPDLPPLVAGEEMIAAARAALPELPDARKQRFISSYALPEADAALLSQTDALGRYFETTAASAGNPKAAANWVMGELQRKLKEQGAEITEAPIRPEHLGELIRMIDRGAVSGPTAKDVFERMCATGRTAADIVSAEGLARIDDTAAIEGAVRAVLEANPSAAGDYRAGKSKTFGFLVGQVMKATGGKANPALVNALLKKALE
jgi:aspartyl-tRNA(Asn)/glutamyl-tRNA(Gln) amidotransferase subunit B